MHASVQITLAAAVVAASVVAAAAAPVTQFPSADLGNAFRANVTHKWRVTGGGSGKCSFEVQYGECYFGSEGNSAYGSTYAQLGRVLPTRGNETAYVSFYFSDAKLRQNVARATINSRKRRLDQLVREGYIRDTKSVVDQLQNVQDPEAGRRYQPLLGNVTITSVTGGLTSSLTRGGETLNVNGVFNYRGSVDTGLSAKAGTLTGQYKIKAVKAPVYMPSAK